MQPLSRATDAQHLERAIRDGVDLPRSWRVRVFAAGEQRGVRVALEVEPRRLTLFSPAALCRAVDDVVRAAVEAPADAILLLPPGMLSESTAAEPSAWLRLREAALAVYRDGALERRERAVDDGALDRRNDADEREARVLDVLAPLWEQVLGASRPRPSDGFFAAGGDSLKAAELVMRASQVLGRPVELRHLLDAPTLGELAARVARDELDAAPTAGIPRAPEAERGVLSYGEQRLWFLWQLEPNSAAYNLAGTARLSGVLERALLERALAALVARHPGLRTTFELVNGAPRRVVAATGSVPCTWLDLSADEPTGRAERLRALIDAAARAPFDLARGPLFAVTCFQLGAGEHVLAFCIHHIVADAASLDVLLEELALLYAAYGEGRHLELPALPVDAADHAVWQRQPLPAAELARRLELWRARLVDEPALLALGRCESEPQRASASASFSFELPPSLGASVRALAAARNVTVFAVLLAGLQLLIARRARNPRVQIGVPVSSRQRPELARVVGFLVDTQIAATPVPSALSVGHFIDAVAADFREAQLGSPLPFERLVDALSPVRRLEDNPLFQVLYNHLAEARRPARFGGLELRDVERWFPDAQFDLALDTSDVGERLRATFTYKTARFSRAGVEALAAEWQRLLEGFVAAPARRLDGVPWLGDAERERLLFRFNQTSRELEPSGYVPELIERRAREQPDAIAVVCEGASLTRAALQTWARRIAGRLGQLGVRPDDVVAVFAERSLELVPALVGVLEAGAAYLPLDPDYPSERIEYMLEHARPRAVLTLERLAERLSSSSLPVLCLDRPSEWQAAPEPSRPALQGDNLAYCIYTSGSTGRPKGALNTHAGLRNRLLWMQEQYRLGAGDQVLQKTPYGFDVSVWEFFWPLIIGARLVVAAPGVHRDPRALAAVISREQVTLLHFVPSMLQAFVSSGELANTPSIRQVMSSGEALPKELAREFKARHSASLHNLYGPTEASIDVSHWTVVDEPSAASVPIGVPIANTRLHVLDGQLAPVPVGAIGELYIGGVGLARGYLARPDLTAERFVPDPFRAGERLYRTGDLARYRADGVIEYEGRVDQQVKLRGFRIELGEIEARLREQPEVGDVAVVVREDAPGQKRLVAYVVPRAPGLEAADPGSAAASEPFTALRERLTRLLPDYMVPSLWVSLGAIPLTSSGKLDRRALPRPELGGSAGEHVAPSGAVEQTLAGIWQSVLGVPRVGRDDNFFELGGDSIVALQVVGKARAAGFALEPKHLFSHQTLAALARVAGEAPAQSSIEALGERGALPLSPIQRWWAERTSADPNHFNQALLLAPNRPLDLERLERALARVVARHGAFRLRFSRTPAGWAQAYAEEAAPIALERVAPSSDVRLAALIERRAEAIQASFELERGPLLRAVYFDARDGAPGRLLLVAHHLVIDGVSWRILLQDLQSAYEAPAAEPLPPPRASYADWVAALERYAASPALLAELDYWREVVAGGVGNGNVGDGNVGAEPEPPTRATERSLRLELSAPQTAALLGPALKPYRSSAQELLVTALARVWTARMGASELLLELEGHGREEAVGAPDVSQTIGWFTARHPVRLRPDTSSLRASILSIKEQLRAVPQRGVGYGVLRYLTPDGQVLNVGAEPLVVFNYLGRTDALLGDAGLFRLAEEGTGRRVSANAAQPVWFELNALVHDGCLRIEWTYNARRHGEAEIAELGQRYIADLIALAEHAASEPRGALSPSDFPLARLTPAELEQLEVAARDVEDIFPLSPLQQGLLLHTLLEPSSGMYVMQDHYRLHSAIDPRAFLGAWQAVVEQHPALRASFVWKLEGRMLQIIQRGLPPPVLYLDLSELSPRERDARLERELSAELERGFPLDRAPLLRFLLVRLDERHFHFVHSYHHILIDAWCRSLLLVDFFAHYAALCSGTVARRPATRPYRDFIAWLGERDLEQTRAYWRRELAGLEAATPLGIERALPASDAAGVADLFVSVTEAELRPLLRLAQTRGLTLNTLAQAAWAVLLAQYAGSDDVVLGVTVAGRPAELPGIESTVGLFINSIPLRVHVPGLGASGADGRLATFLERLLAQNLSMREHEHLPLVEIQALSGVPRGQALFQSLFVFENAPLDASLAARELEFEVSFSGARTHTNYPLTVVVIPEGAALKLQLSYDVRRFAAADVERMLAHFRRLLIAIPEHLERSPSALPTLSAGEQLELERFNATERGYPFQRGYAALFEERARREPERVAASWRGAELSFARLEHRSRAVARALQALGAGPERVVAVLAERGFGWLTAVLGVMRAGAVYLPLDDKLPAARLAQITALSAASALLVEQGRLGLASALLAELPPERRPALLELEHALDPEARLASEGRFDGEASLESLVLHPLNIAYAIYTSGSTGVPKAALVTSAGMLNNQLSKVPFLGLTEHDVIAQTAAPGFDISVWQLLLGPLAGARVEIVPDDIAQDPLRLLEHAARTGVTLLEVVPAVIAGMLAEEAVALPRLRWLLPTGEALAPELARKWLERYPHVPLVNAYGPAECADDVSLELIAQPPDPSVAALPIGAPTDNNRLYVLDRWLAPLPNQLVGELFVAGTGVGRGYLADPALTAERFLPNPFATTPGERLYRTGDLARRRADGRLEYAGRSDQQVKIRGQRIELGEIEARLAEHPELGEAAVLACLDPRGERRLVAYVAPRLEAPSAAGASLVDAERGQRVHTWLAARLPAAMLPSAYVWLEALPRSTNGKVERKALPAPAELDASRAFEEPATDTERAIAEMWQRILKLPRVGRDDGFFELGGHSLFATQVASRVSRAFALDLPVRTLFEAPSLRAFSARVDALRACDDGSRVPRLLPAERGGPLPVSSAQRRLWFLWKLEPKSSVYNLTEAARWRGAFDAAALQQAFEAIVRRHEVLRTTFYERGGEAFQRVMSPGPLDIPFIVANAGGEAEREALALTLAEQEGNRPFDLERDVLLRVKIVELASDDHLVLVTAHHIVSDGWSMHLIVDEFTELYAAHTQARQPRLPELSLQYADYAVWERRWLESGELDRQLAYWTQALGAEHSVLELPADRARPARQTYRGSTYAFDIDVELSRSLREFALARGLTPFSLSLGVFSLLLGRLSGQSDVRVGVPVANRARLELEPLVGFFVNTHVFRAELGDDPSFEEHARRMYRASLDAQAHQDLPFDRLVEALNPPRSTSHSPLFQVLYNHVRPEHDALYALPGTSIRWLDRRVHSTQYDLTVHAVEEGDKLRIFMVFATDLFERSTIERFGAAWRELLRAALAAPDERVSRLRLLPLADERVVLARARGPEAGRSAPAFIHERFEAQAASTPDAPALVFGERSLSYAELNARSNRLARRLREMGVGPEVFVGLYLERSLEMVIALLGVMKAGGAYVPIDPEYPRQRVELMLADAAPRLVLTQAALAERAQASTALPVWPLDELDLEGGLAADLGVPLDPQNAIYCIYTSGSTGRPKGATNTHAGVHNRLAWMLGAHRLGVGERLLQKTPYGFDVSGWEFYWPLLTGATLVMAAPGAHREPAALRQTIERHGIGTVHFVPSMLQAFIQSGELARCPSLRQVFCSGEALPPELAARFFEETTASLHNLYGPTEASIEVSAWSVSALALDHGVPIGVPIDNCSLFVLDRHFRPVPPGVVGELHIGGLPLARGYHQRAELTAERFVPSPFAPGERLYRTGDLARQRADGAIEYVGRADQQVKIRGYRIELGEIEARLLEQPNVAEAAVVVRHAPGGPALLAYLVADAQQNREAAGSGEHDTQAHRDAREQRWGEALRAGLRRSLPEYMVPAQLVWLESMPLTPSGKIDRKALPEPSLDQTRREYVAPRNELEQKLAAIWAEVLNLPRVGVHDNFFELGGHSLLVMQIVSRAREVFGLELAVSSLFQADSVGALASLLARELDAGSSNADLDTMNDLLDELELAP